MVKSKEMPAATGTADTAVVAGAAVATKATVLAVWLAVLAAGYAALGRFEGTPGERHVAPAIWPSASALPRDGERATLLMFVHPRCPCTAAGLQTLRELLERQPEACSARVLVVSPPGADKSFAAAALSRIAMELPAAEVCRDVDGAEAVRFGAATSGQTLLYAADGGLLFAGGVTPARGQQGESAAAAALSAALLSGRAAAAGRQVFGCPLFDKTSSCLEQPCSRQ